MKKFAISIAVALIAIPGSVMLPALGALALGREPEDTAVTFTEEDVGVIHASDTFVEMPEAHIVVTR